MIVGALIGLLIFAVLLGTLLTVVFATGELNNTGFYVLLGCIATTAITTGALIGGAVG